VSQTGIFEDQLEQRLKRRLANEPVALNSTVQARCLATAREVCGRLDPVAGRSFVSYSVPTPDLIGISLCGAANQKKAAPTRRVMETA